MANGECELRMANGEWQRAPKIEMAH